MRRRRGPASAVAARQSGESRRSSERPRNQGRSENRGMISAPPRGKGATLRPRRRRLASSLARRVVATDRRARLSDSERALRAASKRTRLADIPNVCTFVHVSAKCLEARRKQAIDRDATHGESSSREAGEGVRLREEASRENRRPEDRSQQGVAQEDRGQAQEGRADRATDAERNAPDRMRNPARQALIRAPPRPSLDGVGAREKRPKTAGRGSAGRNPAWFPAGTVSFDALAMAADRAQLFPAHDPSRFPLERAHARKPFRP